MLNIAGKSQSELAAAVEDAWWSLRVMRFNLPGTRYGTEVDCSWIMTARNCYSGSGLYRLNLSPHNIDDRIQELIEPYRCRQQSLLWWLGPSAGPTHLKECLEANGVGLVMELDGMALDLNLPGRRLSPRKNLEIVKIRKPDQFMDFCRVWTESIGGNDESCLTMHTVLAPGLSDPQNDWTHFAVLINDRLVATSSVRLEQNWAAIYFVATTETYRNQGLSKLVVSACLDHARVNGQRLAVLQATQAGKPVYIGLGFKSVCPMWIYKWDPEQKEV